MPERSRVLRPAPDGSFRSQLSLYVRLVADALGLRDHEVEVQSRHAAPGRIAEVDLSAFRQTVRLRVCEGFRELPSDDQRHAIVHELVHAHVKALCDTVEQGVPSWMPERTWEMFRGIFERDVEVLVDTIAVLLCPLIEPPSWE